MRSFISLLGAIIFWAAASLAFAQSVPFGSILQGQVWTPSQWNTAWASKLDYSLNSAMVFVGSAENKPAGVTITGDCSVSNAGVFTCLKTSGVAFAPSATIDATDAGNLSSGALPFLRLAGSYTGITGVGTLTAGSIGSGFTAIPNSALANSSTTVNGQSCTLGSTCTVMAAATTITPGATTVTSGTTNGLLYDNAGALGNLATSASGVLVTSAGSVPLISTTLPNGVALGTPASATLTNATGLPVSTGLVGAGTGVLTAIGVNVGTAGSVVVNGGALGTPASGTATNLTGTAAGLTAGNASAVALGGVTGLATGIATFLATPSSANLAAALTNETGTGVAVFGTSPTIGTPAITGGTISSSTITGSAFNGTVGATTPSTGAFTTVSGTGAITAQGAALGGVNITTASALRALTVTYNGIVNLQEYTSINDGGAGPLYYDAADSTTADNGCTVFVDASSHRWKRPVVGGVVHADWCGAGVGGNVATQLQAGLNLGDSTTLVLDRAYQISTALTKSGNNFQIIGTNPGVGLILTTSGAALVLGSKKSLGGAQSTHIVLRNFVIEPSGTATGNAITVYNTEYLVLDQIYVSGSQRGIALGETASGSADDVVNVQITNGTIGNNSDTSLLLNSGCCVWLTNETFSGNGTSTGPAISIGDTYHNWDGVILDGTVFGNYGKDVFCQLTGCANVMITNMQTDRCHVICLQFEPASGGTAHFITIGPGNNITDSPGTGGDTSFGIRLNAISGATVSDVRIVGNLIDYFGENCVFAEGVSRLVVGNNNIDSCGLLTSNTYASVYIQNTDVPMVSGNTITGTFQRYGIQNVTNTNEKSTAIQTDQNNIVGAATAPVL